MEFDICVFATKAFDGRRKFNHLEIKINFRCFYLKLKSLTSVGLFFGNNFQADAVEIAAGWDLMACNATKVFSQILRGVVQSFKN